MFISLAHLLYTPPVIRATIVLVFAACNSLTAWPVLTTSSSRCQVLQGCILSCHDHVSRQTLTTSTQNSPPTELSKSRVQTLMCDVACESASLSPSALCGPLFYLSNGPLLNLGAAEAGVLPGMHLLLHFFIIICDRDENEGRLLCRTLCCRIAIH